MTPSFVSATLAAGLFCISLFAQAAHVNDCLMKKQLNDDLLGRERQLFLVLTNLTVEQSRIGKVGLIFTADAQGKTGYMLQSEAPSGTPSTCYDVRDKFADVHINLEPGVPARILDGTDDAIAARQCEQKARASAYGEGKCAPIQRVLESGTRAGYRVLYWGTSVVTGEKVTVAAKVDNHGAPAGFPGGSGIIFVSSREGATTFDDVLLDTNATGEFLMLVRPISHYPIAARSR